ncbi:MAG: ABC transporter ATP-binding protein [bacterium]|nr:ABC transporter ATP-binding protein [bacterium]
MSIDTECLLSLNNITYTYDDGTVALADVSLDIYAGQRIAVVGPNGAGKSTLFLTMNGVLTPDCGVITCKGTTIEKKNRKLLRQTVGIVFQEADDQMIASTVLGEVSFGPMNLKLPIAEVRARTDEALAYMNLTGFKDRPPHYLSGGEKKRVSIADVLAMKSDIILMDEPTAALDGKNQSMLEDVLERLWQERKTIMISTHDVDFAYRWADWMIVLCDGHILAVGDPVTVFLNDELLQKASLKKPIMLEMTEYLKEKGLLESGVFPRTPGEYIKNHRGGER